MQIFVAVADNRKVKRLSHPSTVTELKFRSNLLPCSHALTSFLFYAVNTVLSPTCLVISQLSLLASSFSSFALFILTTLAPENASVDSEALPNPLL